MKTVLIYRTELLPFSETFILAQTGAMHSIKAEFAGLWPARKSLPLGPNRVLLVQKRSLLSTLAVDSYIRSGWAPRFHRNLRALRPDLLHAHFALDAATLVPFADQIDAPLIVTLHGYDISVKDENQTGTVIGRNYLRRRPRLWDRASAFLCVSEFIRSKAIERGYPPEKLKVHYIGINLDEFVASDRPRDRNLVVFVGRLVEKKGCEYLIRAIKTVNQSVPDAKLVVLGDGHLRQSLEALARDLGVDCRFLGPQPSSVIREWLERARVLCVPSIVAASGDAEGLGMVFCESQAVGTPVVSFHSGGIPEAVLHGETGLLAPERDERMLSQYLSRYLTDDGLWSESSRRGIEWVQKRFNIKEQTRVLEEIYSDALASSAPGQSQQSQAR